MMPASRRNIDTTLHDIRHPRAPSAPAPVLPEHTPRARRQFPARQLLAGVTLLLLFGLGYGLYSSGLITGVTDSIAERRAESAGGPFGKDGVVSAAPDLLFQLPGIFGNIREVIAAFREIGGGVNDLNSRGLALVLSGGGEEFLDILKRIHRNIGILRSVGVDVPDSLLSLDSSSGDESLDQLADIDSLYRGLGAIIGFFDVEEERRIVLLFQNHSEIRPTGGFIGSYGELVVKRGNITDIAVSDIYAPDRDADYKVAPPRELQSITVGWGARDANWFFNYPTSAEKVLELLEASNLYEPRGVTFDGAIALNANVVSDILAVTGPVELPEYGVTLDSENFIFAVREEVESARFEGASENPKKILGALAPVLLERLQEIDSQKKNELALTLLGRALSKDIQFYFRDDELQGFIEDTPFSGTVFEIPEVYSGDYLAVVNSNIAGGKSDIFVEQSVTLESRITPSGVIKNDLTITRRHFGEDEKQPLYRATNQNYVKIFTRPDTALRFAEGITPKSVSPRVDYDEEGYVRDAVLSAVEGTRKVLSAFGVDQYDESGKLVYGAWFSTPAGETGTLKLSYDTAGAFVNNGAKYQFVFDKQSGVESALRYRVFAPPGYVWRDTGTEVFEYTSTGALPGRTTIDLTLIGNE